MSLKQLKLAMKLSQNGLWWFEVVDFWVQTTFENVSMLGDAAPFFSSTTRESLTGIFWTCFTYWTHWSVIHRRTSKGRTLRMIVHLWHVLHPDMISRLSKHDRNVFNSCTDDSRRGILIFARFGHFCKVPATFRRHADVHDNYVEKLFESLTLNWAHFRTQRLKECQKLAPCSTGISLDVIRSEVSSLSLRLRWWPLKRHAVEEYW